MCRGAERLSRMRVHQLLVWLAVWTVTGFAANEQVVADFYNKHASGHTNNWAVLVCASRYWFNYRHMANALGMYRTVKRLGIPDSNIILMLADDVACNSRNKFPGNVYAKAGRHLDLYGDNIEVDYRGYEVTVENFIRLLTGRVNPSVPRSKRLLTDDRSNIFVYMTGHGGNEFLKFQDNEEISAFDIADAFEQMWQKKRYNEIFFMIDTCQANTMYSQFYSPNILATGSSEIEENSYSHENDNDIGVSVIDSYTHFVLEFMEGINKTSQVSVQDLFSSYDPTLIRSHPGVRSDLFRRPLDKTRITDFFGGVAQAETFPPAQERTQQRVLGDDIQPLETSQPTVVSPEHPVTSPFRPDGLRDNITLPLIEMGNEAWDTRYKEVRKWSSVLLVAALVGWVSFT
ncbi:peptidase C13 family-domain-containing protein, partial [Chiua virens]